MLSNLPETCGPQRLSKDKVKQSQLIKKVQTVIREGYVKLGGIKIR